MKILNKVTEVSTTSGELVSIFDSFITGKYDNATYCDFCKKPIDRNEVSTVFKVNEEHIAVHCCNACEVRGISQNQCADIVFSIHSLLNKFRTS